MDDLSQGRTWCSLVERKNGTGVAARRLEPRRKHKNSGNELKKLLKKRKLYFRLAQNELKTKVFLSAQARIRSKKRVLSRGESRGTSTDNKSARWMVDNHP
jgi:hypothetical protein